VARADDAGDVRAVAVIVERITVVVDEVPAADDTMSPAAAEGGMVVVDAGIDDGDAVAAAAIPVAGEDAVQADELAALHPVGVNAALGTGDHSIDGAQVSGRELLPTPGVVVDDGNVVAAEAFLAP